MEHQHTFWGWLNHHWGIISLVYFPAAMMYLNSLAIFLKVMGATKLADFLAKLEEALIAARDAAKAYKQQTTKVVVLLLMIPLFTGCAPLNLYKAGCGNLASTKNTVPYTFGTLDAGGNGCYLIFYGKGTPNFEPIKTMMTTYMTTSKPNTLITSDGSTVMVIPPTKK